MKREELEKLGLTKEQVDAVCDLNNADVQPLKAELQKAQEDLKVEQDKVQTTEAALKKFDGVDVEAAVKALTEAEDSKMLFGEPEPKQVGTGNVIGQVHRAGNPNTEEAAMRAAMGLPPVTEKK